MNILIRHVFFLGLIWGLGLGFATRIPCAQNIDLTSLVAGMKLYDSLIRSGTGSCVYESSPAQEKRLVAIFAFQGRKMRADIIEGLEAGNLKIFNGEFQITLNRRMKRFTKQNKSTIDPVLDPRYWMNGAELFYLEKSLGEYLEQRQSKIIRQEAVDEIHCYVVDVSFHDEIRHLWIAPKMGFRLLKIFDESWSAVHGKRIHINHRLYYTEHKTNGKPVWFPRMVKYEAIDPNASKGEQYLFKNIFQVKDFKMNAPVSSAFELEFPPGTLIHDSSSDTYIPADEILK